MRQAILALLLCAAVSGCTLRGKSSSFRTMGEGSAAQQSAGPSGDAAAFGQVGQLRLGDRYYVASVLAQVYGVDPVTNATLKRLVTQQIPLFGGSCDPYAGDCAQPNQSQTGVTPAMNPARGSLSTRACDELSSNDAYVKAAVAKLGLDAAKSPDADGAAAVFEAFHPQIDAPGAVAAGLAGVAAAAAGNGYPALDQWRFLLLTVCLAPDWQSP